LQKRTIAMTAAVLGLLGHIVILAILGDRPPGPLISNLIQFALGAGAGIAAFLAARRSGKFGRKVWSLAALAIAIYTTGQGFIIYYDSIIRAPLHSPWLSDQFLFFWVVPMLIAVLMDPWPRAGRIDWQQVLDYIQVLIFVLALHVSMRRRHHRSPWDARPRHRLHPKAVQPGRTQAEDTFDVGCCLLSS
jgi:hypothetical protein